MPRCLSQQPLPGDIYMCDYPNCNVLFHMTTPNSSYECGQCRSRYCSLHGNPLFYYQEEEEGGGGGTDQPGHEYEHWDEDLEEDEQKIPKGCITCTKHPKFIEQRVFRDDEVTKFLLKHAKLKDYNEAIKFLKMELSVKAKEKEKEQEKDESAQENLNKKVRLILAERYISKRQPDEHDDWPAPD